MKKHLPGDYTPKNAKAEAIRVNHAGEYGAQRIYAGQLAVLGKSDVAPVIKEMQAQEVEHLETFNDYIRKEHVRPSALLPLWHVAGYALGAGTALMGEKAAMACTVAVETVIADHYQEQLDSLDDSEGELKKTIKKFQADEQEHHDIGIEHDAEHTPFYSLLSGVIKAGCRLSVEVAKRV